MPIKKIKLPLIARLCCDLLIMISIISTTRLYAASITSSFTLSADADKKSSSVGLIGKIALSPTISANAFLGASKKLTGLREESLENGLLGLNGSFEIDRFLQFDSAITLIAPLNQDQRELDSFRGAINFSNGLKFSYKNSSFDYALTNRANLYQYNLNRQNSLNPNYCLTHKISLTHNHKKFVIRFSFNNTHRWSYSGNRISDQFTMEESLTFAASKKVTFTFGHRNGGSTFSANGTDPNIEIFDGDTSLFYTTMNYQF